MRSMLIIGAAASLLSVSAFAQAPAATPAPAAPTGTSAAPANPGPSNPAVKTTEGNNPGAPVEGANSFTEGQAKARIEARGFTDVSVLTKDDKGVWRGTAHQDGKAVQISLDYQGNVVVN